LDISCQHKVLLVYPSPQGSFCLGHRLARPLPTEGFYGRPGDHRASYGGECLAVAAGDREDHPRSLLEYQGREAVARFSASIFGSGRRFDLVPTRANGQPAFGAYLRAPTGGIRHGTGLVVLTLSGDRICAITRFDNSVLPWFGLPRSLPS
jgi:hypothetical protein